MKRIKPETMKRLGSIPGCIALGACDIGGAETVDGDMVYITWGKSLNDHEQHIWKKTSSYELALVTNDLAEVVIPDQIAEYLLNGPKQ